MNPEKEQERPFFRSFSQKMVGLCLLSQIACSVVFCLSLYHVFASWHLHSLCAQELAQLRANFGNTSTLPDEEENRQQSKAIVIQLTKLNIEVDRQKQATIQYMIPTILSVVSCWLVGSLTDSAGNDIWGLIVPYLSSLAGISLPKKRSV